MTDQEVLHLRMSWRDQYREYEMIEADHEKDTEGAGTRSGQADGRSA